MILIQLFSISLILKLEIATLGAPRQTPKTSKTKSKEQCRSRLPWHSESVVCPFPAALFGNLGWRGGCHLFSRESWAWECLQPHSWAPECHPPQLSDSQDPVELREEAGLQSLAEETTQRGRRFFCNWKQLSNHLSNSSPLGLENNLKIIK